MAQLHVIDESFQVMINLLILDLNVLDLVALICVSIGVFVCIHVHLVLEKKMIVYSEALTLRCHLFSKRKPNVLLASVLYVQIFVLGTFCCIFFT